ncbi:AAA family ATPase [Sphingobium yanoikuyae]|nr:AAA family ATPase [Sphingobium yanoikuyae]
MREAEFRAWLDQRLWKGEPLTKKAKDNRVRRCARAERGLKGLGYEKASLEEIFDLGLWEKLIEQLTNMKDDPTVDPSVIKSVVPQAEEPSGQLSNMIAALKQYGYFLAGQDPNYGSTDEADAMDAIVTDEELLSLFDGNEPFRAARQRWTEEQIGSFCKMARAVNAAGLDWYHTSIPQIRFGRRSPENDRAEGTLGSVQLRRDGGFLEFSHQHERLGLAGSYPFDQQSAEQFVSAIANADDAIHAWRTPTPPRPGVWPDETAIDEAESQADRIRQYVLTRYIIPARERGDASVSIVVGPLNNEMRLNMAWPNICQALEGPKFQKLAAVPPPIGEGPKQSTTRKLTFDLSEGASPMAQMKSEPTNLILYGPPGTGKTYRTALEAVKLCDGKADYPETAEGRANLLKRYRELEAEKRIAFVTFHQNYDYENFVEGLRPETGGSGEAEGSTAGFRLAPQPGIFREICALADQARTKPAPAGSSEYDFSGRRFWKMGQGAIGSEDDVYDSAVANNYVTLGWGGTIDWSSDRFSTFDAIKAEWQAQNPEDLTPSHWTQMWPFRCEMKVGDIVIVPYGNTAFRAIAEVTGDYRFEPSAEGYYAHRRDVRWLLTLDEPLPLDTIVDGNFTMRTLYSVPTKRVNLPALGRLIVGEDREDAPTVEQSAPDQFVLIIDEINRANISKVFGELITLIEPDKRLGMPNAITLTLPYSKKKDFGVPANLHIIGTMNTADRSIALLDTALRRRFTFREMAPEPDLLAEASQRTGVDLVATLSAINQRIEYLIDREHRIGHAFFMGCNSAGDVDAAMRDKVIPLLQEYFFEDWSRIAAVLGDGFIGSRTLKCPMGEGDDRRSWFVRWERQVKDRMGFPPDAYARLLGKSRPMVIEAEAAE